ncbi:MAG: hypothetical protein R6T98_02715 [Desulfatiglandales bacterium]
MVFSEVTGGLRPGEPAPRRGQDLSASGRLPHGYETLKNVTIPVII